MPIQTRTIDYTHAGASLEGYFAYDSGFGAPRPAVLIAHAWGGRDEFVCAKARALAELGYPAFALDMYGKGIVGSGPEENARLMGPLMADRASLQSRMTIALDTLKSQPEVDAQRIAAMGFCFGGLCVLDLARTGADFRGAVSFHGLFTAPAPTAGTAIKAKVLVLHGYDDPMATPEGARELAEELTAAGADWQLHWYGGTLHAFTNPMANDPSFGTVYNAAADARSWRSLLDFLAEVLR